MAPQLVIVGYCNNDINRYPDGREQCLPGGAAYFAALSASLSLRGVGLVTQLGVDFHARELVASRFPREGIHESSRKASCSIQTYRSNVDATDRTVELFPGASEELRPEELPDEWLDCARIVHIGTMPPTTQTAFFERVLRSKRRERDPLTGACLPLISVDTEQSFLSNAAHRQAITANIGQSDIVFLNRVEAELLAATISSVPLAVLKRDKDGAEARRFGEVVASTGAPSVQVIDATGAGDVFAGAFLASIIQGMPISGALDVGCSTASRSITAHGISHLL